MRQEFANNLQIVDLILAVAKEEQMLPVFAPSIPST